MEPKCPPHLGLGGMARIPEISIVAGGCGQRLQGTELEDKSSGDGLRDSQWALTGLGVWPDLQRAVELWGGGGQCLPETSHSWGKKGLCWARVWLQNQREESGPKGQVQELQEVESPNSRAPLPGTETDT